jgi:hypothetical protein
MKAFITTILLLVSLVVNSQSKSDYFSILDKDATGSCEYIPKKRMALYSPANAKNILFVSPGMFRRDGKDFLYGIYVEWVSPNIKMDSIIILQTNYGLIYLTESKASKDLNKCGSSVYIPLDKVSEDWLLSAAIVGVVSNGSSYVSFEEDQLYLLSAFSTFKNINIEWFKK